MGTPGSPPARLTAVPDKWVRPIRRLDDLTVGPTDLICDPEDLQKALSDTKRLGVHVKTLAAPPDCPKIAG